MNREILFRGKRIGDGKWIEGFYYKMSETTYVSKEDYEKNPVPTHHYILFERMTDWGMPNQMYQAEIDPETVCQYTGLTDKNGRKIFEGDLIKYHFGDEIAPVKFGLYQNWFDSVYAENFGFYVDWNGKKDLRKDLGYWVNMVKADIIGNIFDNPELLRGA